MTVGEDRVGKRVGLLLQGSTSNTLSSAPQSDQYRNRWTQLPHYERRGETLSLWPHLCQHLQMLFLAVSLSSLAQLAPPLLHLRLHQSLCLRSLPGLFLFASRSQSVFGFLSITVSVAPTSLCLRLSLSPPPSLHLPLYISDHLISVSPTPSPPAQVSIPLSLPSSPHLCLSLSLSVSLCVFWPPCLLALFPAPNPQACSGSRTQMAGHSRHSAYKHRAMAASGISSHPQPLSLLGRSQSSAWPAGDSHSPHGGLSNQVLGQTLPWSTHCATTE